MAASNVERIEPYLEPLRKSVTVACSVEHAFEVFTGRISSWWPLPQYSIGQERARDCAIVPKVGGEIYEVRTTDGAGVASFTVDVPDDIDATVTVTARNAVPYGGIITIGYGVTGVADDEIHGVTALYANYPNPFGPLTTLAFSLAETRRVSITVYDVSGRVVDVLIDVQQLLDWCLQLDGRLQPRPGWRQPPQASRQ